MLSGEVVAVVAAAPLWVGDDGVGLGDLGEAGGGGGIVGIGVWVGGFGEFVELSG